MACVSCLSSGPHSLTLCYHPICKDCEKNLDLEWVCGICGFPIFVPKNIASPSPSSSPEIKGEEYYETEISNISAAYSTIIEKIAARQRVMLAHVEKLKISRMRQESLLADALAQVNTFMNELPDSCSDERREILHAFYMSKLPKLDPIRKFEIDDIPDINRLGRLILGPSSSD